MTDPANNPSDPDVREQSVQTKDYASSELAPEDFYYDGPYLVFTTHYHLKRGYCCNSGCRHCPYR